MHCDVLPVHPSTTDPNWIQYISVQHGSCMWELPVKVTVIRCVGGCIDEMELITLSRRLMLWPGCDILPTRLKATQCTVVICILSSRCTYASMAGISIACVHHTVTYTPGHTSMCAAHLQNNQSLLFEKSFSKMKPGKHYLPVPISTFRDACTCES